MKSFKFAIFSCVAAGLMSACATPPAPTVAAIGFNYVIDNGKANGIVQVFDLSGNTIVHMRNVNLNTTKFVGDNNMPISFKIVGENVALDAIYQSFTVLTANAASRVVRKVDAPAAARAIAATAAPTPSAASAPAPAPDAAIIAEIARMRRELADLKATLAAAAREPVPNTVPNTTVSAVSQTSAHPQVVIVSFPNNSGQFNPAQDQRSQLLALSHSAANIAVRGYTDSDAETPRSNALAKARAEAAKRYLVSMGVSAEKITVDFNGAGNFIADNASPGGRAANRRVEIAGT